MAQIQTVASLRELAERPGTSERRGVKVVVVESQENQLNEVGAVLTILTSQQLQVFLMVARCQSPPLQIRIAARVSI